MPASAEGPFPVARVVDGDTIDVDTPAGTVRVRLIGIDTPETVDPREPVQCFGREASARAHELLDGEAVWLEYDPTQGQVDAYGRALAYVWLADGTLVNEAMIRDGFAFEYTYEIPYRYQDRFRAAEADARARSAGLWSPDACGGDTSQPAAPPPVAPPPGGGACDPNYAGTCVPVVGYDLDCADIGGPVTVVGTDVHRFDGDGDGAGCES